MLTPERWRIVERIFHEALAVPADRRSAMVDSRCGGDAELKAEVSSLLAAESDEEPVDRELAAHVAADWAASAATPTPLVGRDVDGYRVLSLLGAGGMGEVYLAEESALGRHVALKLLPPAFSSDAGRVRRFTEEARAASALNHPNIITVHHVGQFEGRRYMVTEFIDGLTVRARLTGGPLPLPLVIDVGLQCGRALAAAHDAGIIHRDIKPENLMIRHDGYVKVLDFGLAKLAHDETLSGPSSGSLSRPGTRAGAIVGTLDYMAPEQAAGRAVDGRADLYSLSVVMYEMLTGVLPRQLDHSGAGPGGGTPPVPAAVWAVLRSGLATEPADRHASAAALVADLEATRRGSEAPAPRRAGPRVAAAMAALLIVALGLAAWRPALLRGIPGLGRLLPAAAPVTSLAVLPFQWIAKGDQAQSPLERGMADALTTRLGGIKQLRVPPTAAVMANEDPFTAGRRLGVDAVLTGTLQREGTRLRVTAQVSRVSDGGQVWAGRFDGDITDIFRVQDDFAEQIAANLLIDLTATDRAALRRRQSGSPEAYELSLRGREQFGRRTPESIRTAIRMYEDAIRIDARYAPAYAGLAECYAVTASGLPVAVRFPLAKSNAGQAIALDDQFAAGHSALAFVLYKFEWRWRESLLEFQRAIALDPRYPLAHHWYGELLSLLGRHDEAAAQLREALAMDPASVGLRIDFIGTLLYMNRLEEAREVVDSGLRLDEHPRLLIAQGNVMIAEGRVDEGIELQFRGQILQGTPAAEVEAQRQAYRAGGLAGMNARNIQLLSAQIRTGVATTAGQMGLATRLATVYGNAKDRENALKYLAEAIEGREDAALHLRQPQYDFLRGEPRFEALVRRVGMP